MRTGPRNLRNERTGGIVRLGWGEVKRFNAAAGVPFVATLSQLQSQSPESASQARPAHFRPNLHSRRAKESQSGALRSLSARAQSPSSSAPEPGTGPSWLLVSLDSTLAWC